MFIVLEGGIRAKREKGGGDQPVYTAWAPNVTGMLPFSRMTDYPRTARAAVRSWVATFPKRLFGELAARIPELTGQLVGTMSDRIRDVALSDGQHEKLLALSRLSAGVAHELNNPAAAVVRAAEQMQNALRSLLDANVRLDERPLSIEQRRYLACAERETVANLPDLPKLDPVSRIDREAAIGEWLERHGLATAWDLAPALVELDWSDADLEDLASRFDASDLSCVLARLTATVGVGQLLAEIDDAARRISRLIETLKDYSWMDRTPESELDLHAGLDATIAMLGHRLRNGVSVVREYQPAMRPLLGHAGALNQVWTNLIENALDAMAGGGELRVRTFCDHESACVEVIDNGRGMSEEVQRRALEPFFTTKPMGSGMGLGLDTALRIVRQHHGTLTFTCVPGETRFQVRLPFRRQYGI
jgi:signal transduction histidine kinase